MIETIAERLPRGTVANDAGRHRAALAESGPVSDEAEDLEGNDVPLVRRIAAQPLVVLTTMLAVLTLLAARDLIGGGRLMGGALLPAPSSSGELWDVYLASWHPVGIGSGASATPYIGAVAALGTMLFGNASHAVDLLLIGAVPLSGITAYFAVRRVVASRLLRLWAASAYALLPAVTGAVAAGRIGTAAGTILLPIAALGAVRTFGLDGKPGTWRAAWTTGLLLAVMTAFVPVAWLLGVALGVALIITRRAAGVTSLLRALAILAAPVAVLLPWSLDLIRQPSLLFLEAGLPGPDLSEADVNAVDLLLLHPGGPGMYPVWISAGILAAGFAALMRRERRGLVLGGWAAALVGLAIGLVMSRVDVTGPTLATAVPAWPGFPTVLMGAGLLLAALVGAEGARDRIARTAFGWKQPVSIVVSLLAVVAPVLAALWWVSSGADGPLERRSPVVLPAFVAAEGESTDRPRTLVLQERQPGELSYALVRDIGPRLGHAETAPRVADQGGLDQIVREVVSGRGAGQADELADYAVRYVLLTAPLNEELIHALDAVPGLTRVSIDEDTGLWRLNVETARVRIIPPPAAEESETAQAELKSAEAELLPSAEVDVSTPIPAGPAGRTLVLAEYADPGWRATLDGQPLRPTTYDGWAQAFALPETGGTLQLGHDSPARTRWLAIQLLAVAFVFILAMPSGRRLEPGPEMDEGVDVHRRHRARRVPLHAPDEPPFDHAALSNVGARAADLPGAGVPDVAPPRGPAPHEVYEPAVVDAFDDSPPYPRGFPDHGDFVPAEPGPAPYPPPAPEYPEPWAEPGRDPRYYESEPVVPHQARPSALSGSYEVVSDERYPAYDQPGPYPPPHDQRYAEEPRRGEEPRPYDEPARSPGPIPGYGAPDYLTPDPASDFAPEDYLGPEYGPAEYIPPEYGPPEYLATDAGPSYLAGPEEPRVYDPLSYGPPPENGDQPGFTPARPGHPPYEPAWPPSENSVNEEEPPWPRDPYDESRVDADRHPDRPEERSRSRRGRRGGRRK